MINYFKELFATLKRIEEHLSVLSGCVHALYDRNGYREGGAILSLKGGETVAIVESIQQLADRINGNGESK